MVARHMSCETVAAELREDGKLKVVVKKVSRALLGALPSAPDWQHALV